MYFWYIILAFSVIAVLFGIWRLLPAIVLYGRRWRLGRELPGWPTYFLLGNIPQFFPLEVMVEKYRDYIVAERHKMTRTWLGPTKLIVNLHHPDVIREAHKIPKSPTVKNLLCPWLGDGLLLASGDRWQRNRRLLTPAFHFKILEPYVTVYDECAQVLVKKWTLNSRRGEPVDLFRSMSLLSLDIILKCAFSYESKCQEAADDDKQQRYVKAVYELCGLVFHRLFNPLYANSDWLYGLTKAGRRQKELCDLVHRHAEKIIQERRKALGLDDTHGATERKEIFTAVARQDRYLDFLDILLASEDDQGVGLSTLEIRDEVDTFMFEGHDTTATGMSWTLSCLARHPEHQEKIRDEVNRVLDGRDHLAHEDLKELHYTGYCIKEALRFYPPVPSIMRRTVKDTEIGGHTIPEGTDVSFILQLTHHHPDVWDNPEEYDPLRFAPDAVQKPDPLAFLPFSVGSRNCIGQNFAMNEMKVVLAILMQRFRVSLEEGTDASSEPEVIPAIILRPKHTILLRVEQIYK